MVKGVKYDWVDVDKISVLDERYYSPLSDVELEALRRVIRERGEEFSLENPVKVNAANGGGPLILRDGFNRLKIFRELGYKRIYAIIRVFEKEEEAVEVVNIMPKSVEELRILASGWRRFLPTEKLTEILKILSG